MSAKVLYEGNRLVLAGLECACGCRHNQPTQDIYVGTGLLGEIPSYIHKRNLGGKCVLVADKNTYEIAGRTVESALRAAGFVCTLCLIRRQGDVEPDESAVGELLMSMHMDTDFFVSVGSGTVTDITRIVAAHTERPFVCVGTAPSMDGYTSVVAPLLLRGVKINAPAICPEIIVCDLDVLRSAPKEMFVSGVGDVLGKYIAKADWVIGSLVNGEDYCPMCGELVVAAVNRLLENIDAIRDRTEEGARVLIEALLLAGMTIMVIGNTRAVASVEHSIVHYWEMQMLAMGLKPASHGTAVGVSTLLVWPYFTAFMRLDPRSFDLARALAQNPSRLAREAFMREYYGDTAAEAIMAENEGDFLTDEELTRRVSALQSQFPQIVSELDKLPPLTALREALLRLGAPTTPAEIGIPEAVVARSLICAKDYRTRYTIFKSYAELGLPL